MNIKKIILATAVSVFAIAVSVFAITAGAADAPIIIEDWCSAEFDPRGYQTCFISTEDGQTVRYWQRKGRAFWVYPEQD